MSSYRDDIESALFSIRSDVETIQDELETILDMDDIEDMRVAISESIQTTKELLRELV